MSPYDQMSPLEKAHALERIALTFSQMAEEDMRRVILWNRTAAERIAELAAEAQRLRDEHQIEIEAARAALVDLNVFTSPDDIGDAK